MPSCLQRGTAADQDPKILGGGGVGELLYLMPHCHQNDSCIKMGSCMSHFDVAFIEEVKLQSERVCDFKRKDSQAELNPSQPSRIEPMSVSLPALMPCCWTKPPQCNMQGWSQSWKMPTRLTLIRMQMTTYRDKCDYISVCTLLFQFILSPFRRPPTPPEKKPFSSCKRLSHT